MAKGRPPAEPLLETFLASLLETSERCLPCPGCLWPGWRPFKLHFADRESPLAKGGVWSPVCTASWPFVPHTSRDLPAHSAECFSWSRFSPVSGNSIVFFSSYSTRLLYSLLLSLQQLYIWRSHSGLYISTFLSHFPSPNISARFWVNSSAVSSPSPNSLSDYFNLLSHPSSDTFLLLFR